MFTIFVQDDSEFELTPDVELVNFLDVITNDNGGFDVTLDQGIEGGWRHEILGTYKTKPRAVLVARDLLFNFNRFQRWFANPEYIGIGADEDSVNDLIRYEMPVD